MKSKLPTISLDSHREAQDIAKDIHEACRLSGFFQVIDYGHILPASLPSEALSASRQFFDLPLLTKQSLFKADHIAGGYEPYKAMNLNPSDSKGYGHNEGFSFAAPPNPTAWPDLQLPEFRQVMTQYYAGVTALARQIGQYLALGLGLSSNYFDEFFRDQLAHVKLAHYFRPDGVDIVDSAVGVAPHTDWGAITILLQDEVGGLEVFDRDSSQWIQV
jgi:isopenicillin N synthase-like dioxygenase